MPYNDDMMKKLKHVPHDLDKILEEIRNNGGGSGGSASMKKVNITEAQWTLNEQNLYEYTIEHNLLSDIVSTMAMTTDTKEEVEYSYTIIDNTSIKIFISNNLNITVILVGTTKVEENTEMTALGIKTDISKGLFTSENVQLALEEVFTKANEINSTANSTKTKVSELETDINNFQKHKVTADNGRCIYIGESGDLNTLVDNGQYNGVKSATMLNTPAELNDQEWFFVETLAHCHSNTWTYQRLTTMQRNDTQLKFERIRNGTEWLPWRSL